MPPVSGPKTLESFVLNQRCRHAKDGPLATFAVHVAAAPQRLSCYLESSALFPATSMQVFGLSRVRTGAGGVTLRSVLYRQGLGASLKEKFCTEPTSGQQSSARPRPSRFRHSLVRGGLSGLWRNRRTSEYSDWRTSNLYAVVVLYYRPGGGPLQLFRA